MIIVVYADMPCLSPFSGCAPRDPGGAILAAYATGSRPELGLFNNHGSSCGDSEKC